MKKVTLALSVLLALVMLFSCDAGQPSDTTPPDVTTASSGDTITLFADGVSEYKIMRADAASQTIKDAMSQLNKSVESASGVKLTLATDWEIGVDNDTVVENTEKEIIIGVCNRREAIDVKAALSEGQYTVTVVNDKLIFMGADDYATANAVNDFITRYLTEKTQTLSLPRDISITGTASIQKIQLAEGADMRIMSFNIYGTNGDFNARQPNISRAILDYLPDVAGFQEANAKTHSTVLLSSEITDYYAMNCKTHYGKSTVNYTPILYLKSKYNLIEGGVEWLRCRYTSTNTKSLSWAVLEVKESGQKFIVVNIHGSLWASTYTLPEGETYESMRAKAVQWRVDNVKQVLEKIAALQRTYGDIPAFSTGDFNFNSSAEAYGTMISGGMTDSMSIATLKSSTGMASYHSTVGANPGEGLKIDHIFVTEPTVTVLTFIICKRQTELDASDHCPVYADIKFGKN